MRAFSLFAQCTLASWLGVLVWARVARGRGYAVRIAILGGIYSLLAVAMEPPFETILPLYAAFHASVYVSFALLARPRMRSLFCRLVVSWPSAFFLTGTLLALPWAVARGLGFQPAWPWLPYVLGAVGLVQSLTARQETVDLVIGGSAPSPRPVPHPRGDARQARPLCIVQISDPHIGPFMSVERLRRIAAAAVARRPDLVLLTGDFLTMESQADPDLLREALEPLAAMPGRVFACNGNHDHEAPSTVARALEANGIPLLVDDAREVTTDAGPVQIVGMDFVWRGRAEHLARVCKAHPRKPGVLRVVLLHDPGAFRHLPEGEGDLVLSGHTHGGQVGLVSIGLSWTFLRLFGLKLPDHGFWARGDDRLYVHRGTGHYGFPLRLGVPSEESMLRVHRAPAA
jgi:predicted MPP superfamily phosphohydrolase